MGSGLAGTIADIWTCTSMIDGTPEFTYINTMRRIGAQPVAITAVVVVALLIGIGSVVAWRGYTGAAPEQERVTTARVNQARVAQASERLVEKTKGLEESQQQSIDQLQVVQDQLQVMTKLLASQQVETRKLSEQVGSISGTLDALRQSFASVPPVAEPVPAARTRARHSRARVTVVRARPKAVVQRTRGKSRG